VKRLYENKPQEINKVMYFQGQPRTATAALDMVQAIERIFVMSLEAKGDKVESLRRHLAADRLKYLDQIPNILDKDVPAEARTYVTDKAKSVHMHIAERR
jgi:hypothetical protein